MIVSSLTDKAEQQKAHRVALPREVQDVRASATADLRDKLQRGRAVPPAHPAGGGPAAERRAARPVESDHRPGLRLDRQHGDAGPAHRYVPQRLRFIQRDLSTVPEEIERLEGAASARSATPACASRCNATLDSSQRAGRGSAASCSGRMDAGRPATGSLAGRAGHRLLAAASDRQQGCRFRPDRAAARRHPRRGAGAARHRGLAERGLRSSTCDRSVRRAG